MTVMAQFARLFLTGPTTTITGLATGRPSYFALPLSMLNPVLSVDNTTVFRREIYASGLF